ncbi:MAG: zinc metallopeptidase [Lachnospiraceae bacterium]|nr:zinc metallopeptidase [Lachnospiraceae bacterium]
MFYYRDATYILVVIGVIITMIASARVKGTFKKYSKTYNVMGYTAEQVAKMILDSAGITDVRIEKVRGNLTDHYAPTQKVLRLSDSVYGQKSVAAIGVAAHECGHAIQHQVGYAPINLRSVSVPLANIGSYLSWPVVVLGIVLEKVNLIHLGILLFLFVVFFELITLPVEFNASHRAIKILEERNILSNEELPGAKKVLKSAAMTYVAALLSSLLQLLRLVLIANRRRD